MENLKEVVKKIDVFFVKDKDEVILADQALRIFEIPVFSSEESKEKFISEGEDVKNSYLIKEKAGTWRIQSHYIGNGFPVDELEMLSKSYEEKLRKNTNYSIELGGEIARMIAQNKPVDYNLVDRYNKCFIK